jgi:hypothetical protein
MDGRQARVALLLQTSACFRCVLVTSFLPSPAWLALFFHPTLPLVSAATSCQPAASCCCLLPPATAGPADGDGQPGTGCGGGPHLPLQAHGCVAQPPLPFSLSVTQHNQRKHRLRFSRCALHLLGRPACAPPCTLLLHAPPKPAAHSHSLTASLAAPIITRLPCFPLILCPCPAEASRRALPLLMFPLLAAGDLWSIYRELRSIHLRTLNKERAEIIAQHWLAEGRVPTPRQVRPCCPALQGGGGLSACSSSHPPGTLTLYRLQDGTPSSPACCVSACLLPACCCFGSWSAALLEVFAWHTQAHPPASHHIVCAHPARALLASQVSEEERFVLPPHIEGGWGGRVVQDHGRQRLVL